MPNCAPQFFTVDWRLEHDFLHQEILPLSIESRAELLSAFSNVFKPKGTCRVRSDWVRG